MFRIKHTAHVVKENKCFLVGFIGVLNPFFFLIKHIGITLTLESKTCNMQS